MELQEWKKEIIGKAKRQISFRSNMSNSETESLTLVLSDYLDEGISILRKWRKLKDNKEFLSGIHDSSLVAFVHNKYIVNGKELFNSYSSGGVSTGMKQNPESILKSTCKQVV